MNTLFVYGSLQSHGSAFHLLEAHVIHIEKANTHGQLYRLPDGYLGLVQESSSLSTVYGELLKLRPSSQLFHTLDEYEGPEYLRTIIQVSSRSRLIEAYSYVLSAQAVKEKVGTPI